MFANLKKYIYILNKHQNRTQYGLLNPPIGYFLKTHIVKVKKKRKIFLFFISLNFCEVYSVYLTQFLVHILEQNKRCIWQRKRRSCEEGTTQCLRDSLQSLSFSLNRGKAFIVRDIHLALIFFQTRNWTRPKFMALLDVLDQSHFDFRCGIPISPSIDIQTQMAHDTNFPSYQASCHISFPQNIPLWGLGALQQIQMEINSHGKAPNCPQSK